MLRRGSRLSVICLSAAAIPVIGGCAGGSSSAGQQQESKRITVAASAIDAVVRERGVSREQALELAAEDALLARQLGERAPELAHWIERVVIARQMLGALGDEARAGGPPTDAEVTAVSEARFWELDRPRMVGVVHAVVLSSEADPAARELADRIAAATAHAQTDAEFQAAAGAVDSGSFTVKVEVLQPVTLDGRAVDPAAPPPAGPAVQHYDREFAAAAHQLARPGEQSPVLHTSFGYHVLFARSIIPSQQPSLDERRALLHDEIMSQRATALSAALLERQRRELVPVQSRSALASMLQLSTQPLSLQQPSLERPSGRQAPEERPSMRSPGVQP
jgi:hypothetical protein